MGSVCKGFSAGLPWSAVGTPSRRSLRTGDREPCAGGQEQGGVHRGPGSGVRPGLESAHRGPGGLTPGAVHRKSGFLVKQGDFCALRPRETRPGETRSRSEPEPLCWSNDGVLCTHKSRDLTRIAISPYRPYRHRSPDTGGAARSPTSRREPARAGCDGRIKPPASRRA